VVQGQHDHARTEPQPFGFEREGGQRQGRRRAVAVLAEVVLGGPDRVEAIVLGRSHQRELLVHDVVLRFPDRVLEEVQHPDSSRAPAMVPTASVHALVDSYLSGGHILAPHDHRSIARR
jgi:hypothetical protein